MERHEATQTLNALMEQIKIEPRTSDEPILNEQVLASLTSMLPTVLNSALHILDYGKVTKFICEESRRSFYRV